MADLMAPPKPSFLKQRSDPPKALTPLRRRLRAAYVRAVERGWLGLVPLQTHVVICGFPRSGTTLLQAMLETSTANSKSFGRERSALTVARYTWPGRYSILISKKPDDIFHLDEVREHYRTLDTNVRFVVSVRDPRAVLTSIFVSKSGYCVPPVKWRAVYEHIQYQRRYPDVMTSEYRDLIEGPNDVQTQLAEFIDCEIRRRFDQFHTAVPAHFDDRALNGIRPLDRGSFDKWREPKHRPRIQQILREIPELPERLVEMGYETDTAWTRDYL
jgi:hypothetical protein